MTNFVPRPSASSRGSSQRGFSTRSGNWSRPLADLIGTAIDPVFAKQGFGQSSIILYWDEIVGERIAAVAQPLKLQWPPRGSAANPDRKIEPASLVVRVESGFALELQHQAPFILDRINAHLGWKCVGRLSLKQGPLPRSEPSERQRTMPDTKAQRQAESLVGGIDDKALRDALARLGGRVLSDRSRSDKAALAEDFPAPISRPQS